MPFRTFTLSFAALALSVAPSLGQDASGMSAEELSRAFEKQKTRGLVLVPSGDAAAEDDASTEVTSAAYEAVAPEDQVNVKIRFDFDSAALRDDQKPLLATLCEVMRDIDVSVFQIVGHTDASGSADYNRNLSQLRADEVKRHLVTECGIAAERLQAVGMGESAPFDASDPDSEVNRRVEFQALG